MNIADYPKQEPLSDFGRKHYLAMARRNAQLISTEHAYAPHSPQQALLFFSAQRENAPLLLFFHGGGWTNGYKEYCAFMGPLFAQAGIAFATAGYRLAPEHTFPTGWLDCADAVKWCCEHSDLLGISKDRIFVGGFSAGAHYASLLATRRDWQLPRELPAHIVKGCAAISGSYRFDADAGFAVRPRFLGNPALANEIPASPLMNVSPETPPFHLTWGERDFPHLIKQARELALALEHAGTDVDCLELPEMDHIGAGISAGDTASPWFESVCSWLERRCRPGAAEPESGQANAPLKL